MGSASEASASHSFHPRNQAVQKPLDFLKSGDNVRISIIRDYVGAMNIDVTFQNADIHVSFFFLSLCVSYPALNL